MTLSWQIPWQFKLLMNFKDNVKETVPWEQSLFFIFLSGEEKRRLFLESCRAFEVIAARNSRLLNLVISCQTVFWSVSIHLLPYLLFNQWSCFQIRCGMCPLSHSLYRHTYLIAHLTVSSLACLLKSHRYVWCFFLI